MDSSAFSPYTTGSVVSADGTTIGYRQLGHGPGLILVHGGLMTAHKFMRLATALADTFTVTILDRRGRVSSGPHGDQFSIAKECEDIDALLQKTGAHFVFGLSSGALVSLQAALTHPAIHKLALYEPPLMLDDPSNIAWLGRYDEEIARGDLASAFVTILKGADPESFMSRIPRFLLTPLFRKMLQADSGETALGDAPLKDLIPTMHFDGTLVVEMSGSIERFRAMPADVLLVGGSKSAAYLKRALKALNKVLPHVRHIEFPGLDHLSTNNEGQPEPVAQESKRFFSEPPAHA
jgi:pimeloyl-ACP methyl ester carboxylesterase